MNICKKYVYLSPRDLESCVIGNVPKDRSNSISSPKYSECIGLCASGPLHCARSLRDLPVSSLALSSPSF